MSGLEVIGALASTVQLAAYAVKAVAFISDIYDRLKHAPERIEEHAHQIKRLIDIIISIKDNSSLHTTLVFEQLECKIIQADSLRELLVKVLGQYTQPSLRLRYWKALKGKKERQILVALQSLEREKTQLSLCLTAAQSEILQEVQREVRRTESDMSGKGSVYPLSPTSTETHEVSDMVMEGVGSSVPIDNKKETTSCKVVIGRIVSKTQGKQTNTFGKAPAAGVAKEIQVTEVCAEWGGIQTNRF